MSNEEVAIVGFIAITIVVVIYLVTDAYVRSKGIDAIKRVTEIAAEAEKGRKK